MNLAPCADPERSARALPIPALLVVLAVALSVVLGLAGPARANVSQLTILQDDGALLGSAARQQRSLDQVSALGADTIHSLVSWRSLSPSPAARRRPSVDLSDPASLLGLGSLRRTGSGRPGARTQPHPLPRQPDPPLGLALRWRLGAPAAHLPARPRPVRPVRRRPGPALLGLLRTCGSHGIAASPGGPLVDLE